MTDDGISLEEFRRERRVCLLDRPLREIRDDVVPSFPTRGGVLERRICPALFLHRRLPFEGANVPFLVENGVQLLQVVRIFPM